jgi:hypothetical protein
VENFFIYKEFQKTELAGMCADGAPSMMGIYSGFKAHIKQVAPHATFISCVLYRYALAVKTFPPRLSEVFCEDVELLIIIIIEAVPQIPECFQHQVKKLELNLVHFCFIQFTHCLWHTNVLSRVLQLRVEISCSLKERALLKSKNCFGKLRTINSF